MTIGARIRNEGGSLVQIDPFYENLALRQTASVTTSQLGPSGRQALIGVATIQLSGCNEPLLMVKCDSEYVGLRKRTQNGSTYTWEILASTPVVNIQYWIFDTTNVAQMAFNLNQGLRIRSPDGTKVIFDSRYKYMRILSVISLTLGSGPQSVTTPINTGFAIALSNPSLMTIVAGGSIGGAVIEHGKKTGTKVSANHQTECYGERDRPCCGQRRREQHRRKAGISDNGEHGADQRIQHQIARQ